MNSAKIKAYFALLIGIITVSASAILVKLANSPPGITAFYRLFFTVVFMLPFLLQNRGAFRTLSLKKLGWCLFAGVSLAFHFILWFRSLELTSVASSVVLVTLQPLFAFIGSIFIFKEHYRIGAFLGAGFSILGSFLISWGDLHLNVTALIGDLLALAACAVITIYLMVGQHIRQTMSLYSYTFIVYFGATMTLFIYNLVQGHHFGDYSMKDWILFLLLAIFPTLLGHTLFNWSIKWVGVTTISMSILGEPVGASILAYFIFGETLRPLQIIGSLIILSGIGFYLFFEAQDRKKQNVPPLPQNNPDQNLTN